MFSFVVSMLRFMMVQSIMQTVLIFYLRLPCEKLGLTLRTERETRETCYIFWTGKNVQLSKPIILNFVKC
jgi:hypothetical protein